MPKILTQQQKIYSKACNHAATAIVLLCMERFKTIRLLVLFLTCALTDLGVNNTIGLLYWNGISMNTLNVIPTSPVDGKPVYRAGSSVADVFLACSRPTGATVAELKRLFNTDVAMYPITRHADVRGRRGMRWTVTINAKPGTVNLGGMSDTDRVRITNVRKSDAFVNSTHPRSKPGITSALVNARKSAAASDTATANKPATVAVIVNKPNRAARRAKLQKPDLATAAIVARELSAGNTVDLETGEITSPAIA